MQIAVRDIRLARTAADVDARLDDIQRQKASQATNIDAVLAIAQMQNTRERLQKVKSLIDRFVGGAEELAQAQKNSLAEIEKRDAISGEWYRAFQTALNSSVFARIENREEVEGLFYQADAKVNALRALVFRFGATGDTKLVQAIGHDKNHLASLLKQTRDKSEDKKLQELVDGLGAIIKRFLDVTGEFGQDRGPEGRHLRKPHRQGSSKKQVR